MKQASCMSNLGPFVSIPQHGVAQIYIWLIPMLFLKVCSKFDKTAVSKLNSIQKSASQLAKQRVKAEGARMLKEVYHNKISVLVYFHPSNSAYFF